jgi:3'-phosphoadenosine 5'-phosphosulfate sulfotransferase (PAPS reductase)/FAD synthetase
VIDAHGGTLPDDVHVCFANTGREREETLRFVHECATRWNVRIRWLEFITDLKRGYTVADRFEEVGYNSASRDGEPLDRLIARKKALFSTMRGRWCTERCKVGVIHDFMESQGYARGGYTEVIGFRADERDRVFELPRSERNLNRKFAFPLADAEVRKSDVNAWWTAQSFDLGLEKGTGNCDHCPFLGDKARIARVRLFPETVPWWKAREKRFNFSFGYMSFDDIERHIISSPLLPLSEVEADAADSECGAWCTR